MVGRGTANLPYHLLCSLYCETSCSKHFARKRENFESVGNNLAPQTKENANENDRNNIIRKYLYSREQWISMSQKSGWWIYRGGTHWR